MLPAGTPGRIQPARRSLPHSSPPAALRRPGTAAEDGRFTGGRRGVACSREIAVERPQRPVAHRDDPLLPALAANAQELPAAVEVAKAQADELGDPQARGIRELEQRQVARRL